MQQACNILARLRKYAVVLYFTALPLQAKVKQLQA
jgi:hypothetical protein